MKRFFHKLYYQLSLYHFMLATFYVDSFLLIFLTFLKIFRNVDISWLWVLSPIWITFLTIVFLLAFLIGMVYVVNKKGSE